MELKRDREGEDRWSKEKRERKETIDGVRKRESEGADRWSKKKREIRRR